jgi:hypothetical protein
VELQWPRERTKLKCICFDRPVEATFTTNDVDMDIISLKNCKCRLNINVNYLIDPRILFYFFFLYVLDERELLFSLSKGLP